MSRVVVGVAKVTGAALGLSLIGEIASLLNDIVDLYQEVHDSSSKLQNLMADLRADQDIVHNLTKNQKSLPPDSALDEYKRFLEKVQQFIQQYKDKSKMGRVLGKLDTHIQEYQSQRDRIRARLGFQLHGLTIDQMENQETQIREINERVQDLPQILTNTTDIIQALNPKPIQEEWHVSVEEIRANKQEIVNNADKKLSFGQMSTGGNVAIVEMVLVKEKEVQQFKTHASIWYKLRNPHILPFYGANVPTNRSKPAFFLMQRATNGNFRDYLRANPHRLWTLFLDAARGLAYLHSRKPPIVHGNLKCANLLVLADGTGVVSDFYFAFPRASSAVSAKPKPPSSMHWLAPETFDGDNARIQSDVYSLGMCMVEAVNDKKPYAGMTDDQIMETVESTELERPDKISDKAWELISRMCLIDFVERPTMPDVIKELETMAEEELD